MMREQEMSDNDRNDWWRYFERCEVSSQRYMSVNHYRRVKRWV